MTHCLAISNKPIVDKTTVTLANHSHVCAVIRTFPQLLQQTALQLASMNGMHI